MANAKVSALRLQRLTEADYVLDACGRPVPPKGYRFVDLPYVIPFHFDDVVPVPLPTNSGIFNSARVVFLCRGIVVRSDFQWRIKWPSGRFLSQNMEFDAVEQASPQGVGSSLIAFTTPIPIGPDQRITVQLNA